MSEIRATRSRPTIQDEVAKRVERATQEKPITMAELARRAGCSHAQISMFLSGKRGISLERLEAIAMALNVNLAMLLPIERSAIRVDGERERALLEAFRTASASVQAVIEQILLRAAEARSMSARL